VCAFHTVRANIANIVVSYSCLHFDVIIITSVSAAADRPTQRSGSAHAKYSVSHHTVIKLLLLLAKLLNTELDGWCDQQLSDDHQKFMTFAGKLSWLRLRRSAVPEIGLVPSAYQNLNGSRDLTKLLSWMVHHPWASTCCRQPTYLIWSLCLHSPRRYERRYKMSKMGWFGVVRITQGHRK